MDKSDDVMIVEKILDARMRKVKKLKKADGEGTRLAFINHFLTVVGYGNYSFTRLN